MLLLVYNVMQLGGNFMTFINNISWILIGFWILFAGIGLYTMLLIIKALKKYLAK